MGNKSVVAFSLALLPCFSFLLFGGWWSGMFVGMNDVVSDGRGSGGMWSDVQCFACRGGWSVLVKMSEVLLSEATPRSSWFLQHSLV